LGLVREYDRFVTEDPLALSGRAIMHLLTS
jgi:hypothetical protein